MRVLVVGASGFIGSAVVAALCRSGVETRCVVRNVEPFRRRFPETDARALDLTSADALSADRWAVLLNGIDAVVNVAGVLQPRRAREAWAVHRDAPDALFGACESKEIRRVVHVSAVGIEDTETVYARSKRAGEESLTARDLDWTVLRPAVVVGDGSHGGSSLLRALAVMPFVTPVIGDGTTPMDVIHKDDLASGIVNLLRSGAGIRAVLEPAGPGRLSLAEAVTAYRNWFGLRPRPTLGVPNWLATAVARFGDATQMHPMTSTALAQFRARLTGDAATFAQMAGVRPVSLANALSARPCESQDLWHARLFLLRPLVRLGLALLWLVSGLVGIFSDPALYAPLLGPLADTPGRAMAIGVLAAAIDLAIALALVLGWRLKAMAWVQIAAISAYTLGLSVLAPAMWGDFLGGLLKNLPILILVLVHRVLEEER